ncbi:unnamed protein product, partial [Protopolystoma xenopodis]
MLLGAEGSAAIPNSNKSFKSPASTLSRRYSSSRVNHPGTASSQPTSSSQSTTTSSHLSSVSPQPTPLSVSIHCHSIPSNVSSATSTNTSSFSLAESVSHAIQRLPKLRQSPGPKLIPVTSNSVSTTASDMHSRLPLNQRASITTDQTISVSILPVGQQELADSQSASDQTHSSSSPNMSVLPTNCEAVLPRYPQVPSRLLEGADSNSVHQQHQCHSLLSPRCHPQSSPHSGSVHNTNSASTSQTGQPILRDARIEPCQTTFTHPSVNQRTTSSH